MKKNKSTRIIGQNVILVPYKEKHVTRYHEWMKSPELQYLTASEPLTLAEEYEMQKDWLLDEKKCTFIILDKSIFESTGDEIAAMIGDTNLFFNDMECKYTAEAEIMIAEKEYRHKRRGWEAILLMLRYEEISIILFYSIYITSLNKIVTFVGIDVLNIKRYRVKIMIVNEKSINMFRKLNFHEVERSEIFQEITMENNINQEWKDWLYLETMNSVMDECYNIK
ncbi:N-acetyltransferase 9-like protein [Vespula maculifrons]|uniref:N-acetyltransferase 9-like protein n=1 Tax=Vespula maculifrons TaxID=7453 RepID=A0ABD2CGC8_VESMC